MPSYPPSQTPSGNTVTQALYQQYQQYVVDSQSNGQPAMSYDQWMQSQANNTSNVQKFF